MSLGMARHATRSWPSAPADLILRVDEVHVWRATLNLPPSQVQYLRRILAPDEGARADRFHFERDRVRFVAARAILRTILGRYLGVEPSQVLLGYGPQGKPRLAGQYEPAGLCFNVTHSHTLALYAIVRERPVGVDVERIRTDLGFEEMADRFFSPTEVAELRALPAYEQVDAFFRCWTRKEAYLKARGDGLTVPAHQFSVPLQPCLPFAPLRVGVAGYAEGEWYIRALDPGAGYAAAMVVQGAAQRLQRWQWAYGD